MASAADAPTGRRGGDLAATGPSRAEPLVSWFSSELQTVLSASSDSAEPQFASSWARPGGRASRPGEVLPMSTALAPAAAGRRSRRWWYVLAIGVIVVVLAVGTFLTLRLHPF